MLTVNDLLNENKVSSMNDISLKLYKNFNDDILCKRIFIYELEGGKQMKVVFQPNNLLHILGAQHILGKKYKAEKFNEEIHLGNMTFAELERRNSIVFNDFTDRFLNFSNLYYVLTNCDLVYFDKDIYNKNKKNDIASKMDFTHILFQNVNNKKVHAGLDTYNKGFNYYCKSLLVRSIVNEGIIKEQKPVKIKNIKVIDVKSKRILLNKNITTTVDSYVAVGQVTGDE